MFSGDEMSSKPFRDLKAMLLNCVSDSLHTAETESLPGQIHLPRYDFGLCRHVEEPTKVMLTGPKGTEQNSIAQCSVCGRIEEIYELPGRTEKCCLECSADVATAILLRTEIDAAIFANRSIEALVAEFSEVSSRILKRSQSAEIGNA
jgi:hypothetical protein